ncbi:MAG: hypothetical protein K8F35_01725 [Dokdonella sp.]|uniref:hypothetical protein n=1 Tax=Dokdonella sp. TaxID=2291710 RepID=UPI0025C6C008|nr:hypothetical protein [Dokdonella sp.]MBZ0221724.1 hypothetical protein [Dokdonella sp.]
MKMNKRMQASESPEGRSVARPGIGMESAPGSLTACRHLMIWRIHDTGATSGSDDPPGVVEVMP